MAKVCAVSSLYCESYIHDNERLGWTTPVLSLHLSAGNIHRRVKLLKISHWLVRCAQASLLEHTQQVHRWVVCGETMHLCDIDPWLHHVEMLRGSQLLWGAWTGNIWTLPLSWLLTNLAALLLASKRHSVNPCFSNYTTSPWLLKAPMLSSFTPKCWL